MSDLTFTRLDQLNLVRLNSPEARTWADKHLNREGWLFVGEGMVALSQEATPQALLAARQDLLAIKITSHKAA